MVLQLGYAAATARLLLPEAYAGYAVAGSAIGLLGMLGGSTLGLAVARRPEESPTIDRGLASVAAVWGVTVTLVAVLLAGPWGSLWAVPDAEQTTRLLALGLPASAIGAVYAGILRRCSMTPRIAAANATGQVVGMAVGIASVAALRQAWTLAVMSVVASSTTAVILAASVLPNRRVPGRPTRGLLTDTIYASKFALMNLLRYASLSVPVWAIGRYAGPQALGGYNRATAIVTAPLEAIQSSFSFALFAELRPGGRAFRDRFLYTDILIFVTWSAAVLGVLGYFAAPAAVLLLLGPGWQSAVEVASVAALLGVLPMVAVPLWAAVEAQGLFRASLVAWLAGLPAVAIAVGMTVKTGSAQLAMLGLLAASGFGVISNTFVLARLGLLGVTRWASECLPVMTLQAAVLIPVLWWSSTKFGGTSAEYLLVVAVVGCLELTMLWILRMWTPIGRIARRHGVPGFG
jgi:O-antigen/teichoic acid export membrane protein